MHEPTNPLAESPNPPMRRRAEIARLGSSEAPSGNVPGSVGGPAPITYREDAALETLNRMLKKMNDAPPRIYNWLDTQMSVARHFGGLAFKGQRYVIAYHEDGQPLVRFDVFQAEDKAAQEAIKARRKSDSQSAADAQGGLL